jgi:hypothetical protein
MNEKLTHGREYYEGMRDGANLLYSLIVTGPTLHYYFENVLARIECEEQEALAAQAELMEKPMTTRSARCIVCGRPLIRALMGRKFLFALPSSQANEILCPVCVEIFDGRLSTTNHPIDLQERT